MARKKTSVTKQVAAVEAALRAPTPGVRVLQPSDFLSSGCTTLNLACTGHTKGCLAKGHYLLFVGDSSSGKTRFALTMLAEAANNPNFDDYDLIYDPVENGNLMNVAKMFGSKAADRIRTPDKVSFVIEDFYNTLRRLQQKEHKFIYVLDSADALDSAAAQEKFEETMDAHEIGGDVKGSYGDGKAKKHSEMLRSVVSKLEQTGSILIILGQTRDNLAPGTWEKKIRAGGRALKFYAHLEMWSSTTEHLSITVGGKPRPIGIRTQIAIKKNRYQGWEGKVSDILIYRRYGIDDVGSCIDFLITEKHWTKADKGGKIIAPDFEFEGRRDILLKKIESENLERQLRRIVAAVWKEIDDGAEPARKPRYS